MKIIDKYKDYYDWMVSIYGMDPKIIYDRRGSIKIDTNHNDSDFYSSQLCGQYGKLKNENNTISIDTLLKLFSHKIYTKDDYEARWYRYFDKTTPQNFYFVLQVGYVRYIFKVERFLNENNKIVLKPSLFKKDDNVRKDYSNAPIYLYGLQYNKWSNEFIEDYGNDNTRITKNPKPNLLENPILNNTYITGFISPNEMWNNIYNYLISVNDKEIIDTRTNDQHIESNGFDKKISFRNIK